MRTSVLTCLLLGASAALVWAAPDTFSVASIRPSSGSVKFEHDGKTETMPGTLTMRDVLVSTCIKWAYGVQDSQISGPEWIGAERFDILAKADAPATVDQMKVMMQVLLKERFGLSFHRRSKELSSYALTIAKDGHKLKEAAVDEKTSRTNSAIGTVAKAMTMREFADFMSGPLRMPVVDATGLNGRYDFMLDFTPYLPGGEQVMKVDFDNTNGIILAALQGELGLKLESKKESMEVLVIDHIERPSDN